MEMQEQKEFLTAKEAADLHSNIFSQYILWDYLSHNDIEVHIEKIRMLYKEQCATMLSAMETYFPKNVSFSVCVPESIRDISSVEHTDKANLSHKVKLSWAETYCTI